MNNRERLMLACALAGAAACSILLGSPALLAIGVKAMSFGAIELGVRLVRRRHLAASTASVVPGKARRGGR